MPSRAAAACTADTGHGTASEVAEVVVEGGTAAAAPAAEALLALVSEALLVSVSLGDAENIVERGERWVAPDALSVVMLGVAVGSLAVAAESSAEKAALAAATADATAGAADVGPSHAVAGVLLTEVAEGAFAASMEGTEVVAVAVLVFAVSALGPSHAVAGVLLAETAGGALAASVEIARFEAAALVLAEPATAPSVKTALVRRHMERLEWKDMH